MSRDLQLVIILGGTGLWFYSWWPSSVGQASGSVVGDCPRWDRSRVPKLMIVLGAGQVSGPQPLPPPQEDNGGADRGHRPVDQSPSRAATQIPPPPSGGKMRKGLARVRKELAGRFYQLLSGHSATAEHLRWIGQARASRCWWCGGGERQTRFLLLVKC